MFKSLTSVALLCVLLLAGCGKRVVRVDLVPVEDRLQAQEIERDPGMFISDEIVMAIRSTEAS